MSDQIAAAPLAPARPVTTTHHGRTRVDDHDWLRDKESPEVLAHLEAENAWTTQRTAHLADLRETIFGEIKARTRETDLSVPTRVRGHWYYGRSFEGREYGASCRVPVGDPDDWTPPQPADDARPDEPALPGEEVLLDLDALAQGHDFFSLGGSSISRDDRLLAYATDVVGDERYTIRVKDLATGELLADEITGALGGATWGADSGEFYYTTVDASWRADTIWRHRVGTPQSEDEVVFHDPDERFWVGVGRTRSQAYLAIATGSKTTSEYHLIDLREPGAAPVCFHPREEGLEYSVEHAVIGGEDRFLVLHNGTSADFELAVTPAAPTPRAQWVPLLPAAEGVRLEDVDAFATHLVVNQRSAGLTQLRILDLGPDGITDDHLVEFDRPVYTVGSGSNPEFAQPTVRLGYTSMALPSSVYDYEVATRSLRLLRQAPVLGGYDPEDYEEHRIWAPSTDGASVPVSIVVRRDARAAGAPVPLHLYAYGAYEASMDPGFSIARLSLLDRGAAFAIAHVRGGGEMGRHWYDDGKLSRKQHTFDDFVAAARHLVATGWTTHDRLTGEGGSAGGLMIGAVANQAPEAFAGLAAGVPFVDPLRSMLDASLPLTVTEYDEWGNPEADPEAYDTIAAYAPYDNVTAQRYPRILAETSLHDTRVLYVEPAKWIARLRERAIEPDVLLRIEMAGGHGGASGRYQAWRDRAFTLAWILDVLGLAEA
ncbi:S9 family peptidase [Nocardioides sp.]|uniref:S9 family peptidase n=1 Tax=Nocardioides sp. TaxID=35761 RepID=UPI0035196824